MQVLLATDGSAHGVACVRTAFRLLSEEDCGVTVLCVAPGVHPKKPGLQNRVERHAKKIAERMVRALVEDGVSAKPLVHVGSPAGTLIGCARSYDLTVISAQSHKGVSVAGLGPVTSRVLEHATSSVLVARGGGSGTTPKILIPVDGSDAAFRALEKLKTIIDLPASEVTLMHVVETPWIRPIDDQEWPTTEGESDQEPQSQLENEFTLEAEALLEQARDQLPAATSVSTRLYRGIPADEILTELDSGDYDLIVLAATGERDLKHRILGSVSSKVAWNAPCSVLLIR